MFIPGIIHIHYLLKDMLFVKGDKEGRLFVKGDKIMLYISIHKYLFEKKNDGL